MADVKNRYANNERRQYAIQVAYVSPPTLKNSTNIFVIATIFCRNFKTRVIPLRALSHTARSCTTDRVRRGRVLASYMRLCQEWRRLEK